MRLFVTDKEMLTWDVFQELQAKGNLVKAITLKSNTLILGPSAHRILRGMEKYVEVAIKSARQVYVPVVKVSRPKPAKKTKVKKGAPI